MKTTTMRRALFACSLGLFSACAGTPLAFGTRYKDNDKQDVQQLLARVQNAPPRNSGTIAVGITTGPSPQLYAYDLASQTTLWKQPVAATSAPLLAGESVIFQTASSIVAVALRTGQKQVEVSRGDKVLRGADGEGALAVFVMGEGMGTFAKSEVVLLRRGAVDWTRPIHGMVGVPSVVGTVVLVPWSNQYVSAVDVESGREVARVRVLDSVLAHALRDREHTYVGSTRGVALLSATVSTGSLSPNMLKLPDQNLPGRPQLLRDVYAQAAPPTPDSAQHRIALVWEPRVLDNARVGFEDDTIYLVFYRFVFALSPADYGVRWVHRSETDIVGAAAEPGGVVIADASGGLTELAASSGEEIARSSTGLASDVVRVPTGMRSTDAGAPLSIDARRASLLAAAQDTDARMVPARILAVRALAKLQEADATASLIALCEDRSLAPAVRTEGCVALRSRSLGSEYLLAALGRHAAFLTHTSAPPVGALAKAAVGAKETRAAGPLTEHLLDPETESSDLVVVVNALQDLGDPSATKPLESFLLRYHADPIDAELVSALEQVPAVLAKLEGQAAVPALTAVVDDGLGISSVRQKASEVLDALKAQADAEAAKKAAEEAAKDAPPEEEAPPAVTTVDEEEMPTHLTTEMLDKALLPVRDQLQACVANDDKFQARAVLVIEDGAVLMVSVLPANLQSCIEPLIRSQQFPKTRYPKKERVTYIVKR